MLKKKYQKKINIKELIETDLIQARILRKGKLTYWKLGLLFLQSKTCRIHTYIRMRSGNPIVSHISKILLNKFFIEIGNNTKIGKYFILPHPRCVIIADNVEIGEHVHVGQSVTIGGNFKKTQIRENNKIQKLPIIGNRVNILPGAVIGGPVIIGDDVIVGANAVVTHDIPNNSIVYGHNQLSKKKISLAIEGGRYSII